MKLELLDCADTDYGSYIRIAVGAGDIAAEVDVQDGQNGRKITVEVGGESHVIEVVG